jgi:hypothetical protein
MAIYRKSFLLSFTLIFICALSFAANDTTSVKKKIKSGWSFGAIPVIAFDTDIGLKYGGLVNFYHYGDGTIYPEYKHSIYLEWSRTTKGSGINQITYDSKYLIPGVRVSGELSYLTEKALDFYGFNGYKTLYNSDYEDDSPNNQDYRSRLFYRQERKLLRIRADFSGRLKYNNVNWVLGIVHYNVKIDTIDINKLNKGQADDKKLPAIGGGLYGDYKIWGVLPANQYYGGQSTLFKTGIIYDSRDNEPNPMRGIWTELLLLFDPGVFGGNSYSYGKFAFTHRQYFTLLPERLSFAYRLAYQGNLFGKTPAYMLPFIFNAGRYSDRDGLGGARTIRGILRNRIVGEDMAYGNFEMRWKFIQSVVFNQNIYLALSAFTDMGLITRNYSVNTNNVPDEDEIFFPNDNEGIHQSIGAGFRVALNENFIIAADYGVALDKRDGDTGLYINLNWLF